MHTIETNVHGTEVVLQATPPRRRSWCSSPRRPRSTARAPMCRSARTADLVLGRDHAASLGLCLQQGARRVPGAGVLEGKKLPVVIVRFFNTVGPRQTGQYGMVVPTFVRQALAGEPITVYGDGTQSRSFTYVGDVVGALLKLIDRAEGDRRGVQHRQRRGSDDPRSSPSASRRAPAAHSAISYDPLRGGLRGGLRGHAAAGAGHLSKIHTPDRLRAEGRARRDHPEGRGQPARRIIRLEGNCHADDLRRRPWARRAPRLPPRSSCS